MRKMTHYFWILFTVIGSLSLGLPNNLISALDTEPSTPFDQTGDVQPNTNISLPDLQETLRKPDLQKSTASDTQNTNSPKQPSTYLYPLPAFSQSPPIHTSQDTPGQSVIQRKAVSGQITPAINVHPNANVTSSSQQSPPDPSKTILINFNNVNIIEYLRFISRISNRNFIFDENDLQFNVTIVSEEPTTIDNIMTALLQELRIHNLILIEDENNFLIHRNAKVNSISKVVSDEISNGQSSGAEIITQVFRLNILDPNRAAAILKPLVSDASLIEVLQQSNHLIITDLASNIVKIGQLLKILDAPNSGAIIGQYVSKLPIDTLIPLAQQILQPISMDQTITFVPHDTTNSIFIIGSPYLVERAIAILQYLDQSTASTQILDLNDVQINELMRNLNTHTDEESLEELLRNMNADEARATIDQRDKSAQLLKDKENLEFGGVWVRNPDGTWTFMPAGGIQGKEPPIGSWIRNAAGQWRFNAGEAPSEAESENTLNGKWTLDKDGNWVFKLASNESYNPGVFIRQYQGKIALPGGVKKVTKFFIYKLQYRKGDVIEPLLRQVADTLLQNERGNEDLITTLRSVQWLSVPNSLIFSGTEEALDKARALTIEMDSPTRQVFIEMLILESTLTDSLQYGVSYGTRFGGGNTTGSQSFFSNAQSPLAGSLSSTGFSGLGGAVGGLKQLIPDGTKLTSTNPGLNLGVIGQKITHCGTEFGSIGALVNALHDRSKDKVVSNPKLLVEDNSPAEIFVGINTPYRTQSISNDIGSVITSNYVYQDVGTRLRITPYLGNGDVVALDLEEEVSTILDGLITNASTASTSPGPTTRINRTTTRVHIPDTYFLVISGMMQHQETRERNQVPCLGGVPILGAAFSAKINSDNKRNLMIFIRPQIIDTKSQINELTKHQQDIYDYKNNLKNSDEYETVEALDLFNITQTLHPEDEPQEDKDRP